MPVSVTLTKKIDRSKEVRKRTDDETFLALMATALAIETDVKSGPNAAPHKTGNLQNSYNVKPNRSSMYVDVGADPRIAPYAPFVEFGTSRAPAQPHLRPAAKAQTKPHAKRLREAMARAARSLK